MKTDSQIAYFNYLIDEKGMSTKQAAAEADMSESTAHKYKRTRKKPSELKKPPRSSRRRDVFADVWSECVDFLKADSTLEATALFEHLLDKYPSVFKRRQLRTFQRRVKAWKSQQRKEVFFPQVYHPGERAQSDFTCMNQLSISIQGEYFPHLLYHFVLSYSNWESVMVCKSESYMALEAGFQKAISDLGGVPMIHQTDSMSCAVKNRSDSDVFTVAYKALMAHYGVEPKRTQPGCPHENGKVEQAHHRLKRAITNALTLRKDRDFDSLEQYEQFLEKIVSRMNATRASEVEQERKALRALPMHRLASGVEWKVPYGVICKN